jgi:hypothetical protein
VDVETGSKNRTPLPGAAVLEVAAAEAAAVLEVAAAEAAGSSPPGSKAWGPAVDVDAGFS